MDYVLATIGLIAAILAVVFLRDVVAYHMGVRKLRKQHRDYWERK